MIFLLFKNILINFLNILTFDDDADEDSPKSLLIHQNRYFSYLYFFSWLEFGMRTLYFIDVYGLVRLLGS